MQVFRTPDGKNNGLIACCGFEAGTAVGEFVGQVTTGLANLDVMIGQTEKTTYQIFQGRQGNHTRFINHSCRPNSEYQKFVWLGIQRIVLISKGIRADEEVTVDYSDTYWQVRVAILPSMNGSKLIIIGRIWTKSAYAGIQNAGTRTKTGIC